MSSSESTPLDNNESFTNGLASDLARLNLAPRRGRLVPLRTKDEVRAALETFQAYVIELPSRYASAIKDVINAAIPDLKQAEFQHLRRVVQFKFLPAHLQKTFKSPRGGYDSASDDDDAEEDETVRYFLVSPTTAIQHADLLAALREVPPFANRTAPPRIFYVTCPTLPPTSTEQAQQWSNEYWPIAYKNTNPFGPHPSLVARNLAEVEADAGGWLALAQSAGKHTCEMGLGESIGCVIVNNADNRKDIIAIAGDSRWRAPFSEVESKGGPGNVMAHAVQRAVAMVAKKRLRAAGKDPDMLDRKLFCDSPLTDLEKLYYDLDNIPSSGYLCVELDIYLTHEPCVMCSMAILHSRFKRVIFGRRMPRTGGLTADTVKGKIDKEVTSDKGLGHGIFWRPSELNWKLLAWEWEEAEENNEMITTSIPDTLQA